MSSLHKPSDVCESRCILAAEPVSAGETMAEDECIICFEALESRGGAVELPCACKVAYCAQCWDRSLAASMTACGWALCPSCRSSMQVDFDATTGRLLFKRSSGPTNEGITQDDWRRRLYRQARPMQIQLLQEFGAKAVASGPIEPNESRTCAPAEEVADNSPATSSMPSKRNRDASSSSRSLESRLPDAAKDNPPRCVCGCRLTYTSVRERVLAFIKEETPVPLTHDQLEYMMQRPPIKCDLCDHQVERSGSVWTCENGRRTVLHSVAYDVCEACFSLYAYGIEGNSDVSIDEDDLEDDPDTSWFDECSDTGETCSEPRGNGSEEQ